MNESEFEDTAWDSLIESLDEFSDDFLEERNQPNYQESGSLF